MAPPTDDGLNHPAVPVDREEPGRQVRDSSLDPSLSILPIPRQDALTSPETVRLGKISSRERSNHPNQGRRQPYPIQPRLYDPVDTAICRLRSLAHVSG